MFARRLSLFLLLTLFLPRSSWEQPRSARTSTPVRPRGVALVLSGGGAKGLAHIGVLDVLDSAHVPIDLIVGTSIGAAVGGLYAAGYTPAQLETFAVNTNWIDVLGLGEESHRDERILSQKDADNALLSLRFSGFLHPVLPQALSTGQRLTMLLNSMVIRAPGGIPQDFLRDMRVPFVAVATDIVNGERRLLTNGDLTEALRASATLPLRFNPLDQDSAILMDGGLLANIPVDVAQAYDPLSIIVSNTTAPLKGRDELTTPWDVADQVISLMMQRQNAAQLKNASVVITPAIASSSNNDFSDIPGLIEEGRIAARAALPAILQSIAERLQPTKIVAGDTLLPSLNEVRVFGSVKDFRDTALLADRSLLQQPLVTSGSLATIERWLLTDYRQHGFSLSRIDSVVLHRGTGGADFYVDEGHISRIQIRGNDVVHPDVILRELPLYSGDVFRSQDADRASLNLTATGLFDFATLQIDRDTLWPGTRIFYREDTSTSGLSPNFQPSYGPTILVTVRAHAYNVLRLGVLADNEFGAQFSTELANENVGGTGLLVSLKGGLGPDSRFATFTVDAPRLFQSLATFLGQAYTEYTDINEYQLQTISDKGRIVSNISDVRRESRDFGARLDVGGEVGRLGALTMELRSEQQSWFSLRDTNAPKSSLRMTALRGVLVIDSRDDAAYPHSGTLLSAYAETGLRFLGGESAYTKIYADLEQAIALSSLHTLIPRIMAGFADSPLPLLEHFSLGGIESFYGLNQYELRGKQLLEGSLTYQIAIPHALFFPTFFSTRYDIGSTWPEPESIKFESLVHGIGAQVGLKTPLGLARFGIGENFRFSQNPNKPIDLNKPRFYFSIGSRL